MPDWYPYIKAAKYLGCRPWELFDQHPAWIAWAIGGDGAEQRAREAAQRHHDASQRARNQWQGSQQ